MQALREFFDGSTRFGWWALASVHVHLALAWWLVGRRARGAELEAKSASRAVSLLPCARHSERLTYLEDAHARLAAR